jgi:hypothetical protein
MRGRRFATTNARLQKSSLVMAGLVPDHDVENGSIITKFGLTLGRHLERQHL